MWQADQYQLLDFGNGRKLERFGRFIVDRSCPAALGVQPLTPEQWTLATIRLRASGGSSSIEFDRRPDGEIWLLEHEGLQFELRITPFGHLGVFPEHAVNWQWLAGCSPQAGSALNLFAYTGGASLYLAQRGWQVVHVDASSPSVAWARRNAELSGLSAAPIRWIVDDARAFVKREVRRGRRYDAVILDPPSYGHGPKGKAWRIENDLHDLLIDCSRLTSGPSGCIVLTGHSEGYDYRQLDLEQLLGQSQPTQLSIETGRLGLDQITSSRQLDCGWFARIQSSKLDGRFS